MKSLMHSTDEIAACKRERSVWTSIVEIAVEIAKEETQNVGVIHIEDRVEQRAERRQQARRQARTRHLEAHREVELAIIR